MRYDCDMFFVSLNLTWIAYEGTSSIPCWKNKYFWRFMETWFRSDRPFSSGWLELVNHVRPATDQLASVLFPAGYMTVSERKPGHSQEEKTKAEERTDLSLSDCGSPCLLGGRGLGWRGHITNMDKHRGEGVRGGVEGEPGANGAKTHGEGAQHNNNTTQTPTPTYTK